MTTEPAHARIVPTDHPCFDDFVATIAALRAPDGCPWDRAQTHQSIAHNMIEEAYEAVDAIESGDTAHLREELGDVLLQVVLQSQIAADAGAFDIDDVCADVNAKMIRRHPHVFGEARADNASEVLDLWDQVKLAERSSQSAAASYRALRLPAPRPETLRRRLLRRAPGPRAPVRRRCRSSVAGVADQAARREGLLDGVPTSFPALMQAQKVSRKAASAGFEWDTLDDVWEKVREEVDELRAAYAAAPKAANGKVDAGAAEGDAACGRAGGGQRGGRVRRRAVLAGATWVATWASMRRTRCAPRAASFDAAGRSWRARPGRGDDGRRARARRARGPVAAGQGPRARVALRGVAAANPGCTSRPPCASTRPPKRIFAGRAMAPGSRKR